MSGGIISKKHLDAVNARLEELESNSLAMAKVITRQHQTIGEQQLKIDAMALCLKAELGISIERAQGYRQQVMDERQREIEEAQQRQTVGLAVPADETKPASGESNPASGESIEAESESKPAASETANAA